MLYGQAMLVQQTDRNVAQAFFLLPSSLTCNIEIVLTQVHRGYDYGVAVL